MNRDIKHALEYHDITKHSEASLANSRHYLDFDNKPIAFKTYLDLSSIPLPEFFPTPEGNAIRNISGTGCNSSHTISSTVSKSATPSISKSINRIAMNGSEITIEKLAEILFFSAGITRVMKFPYGTYYMRAASATGALYPIELYVVCDDISPSLSAGVYHFSPADFSLSTIRNGNYKSFVAASSNNYEILASPITIVFTSIAWRNAWKYQARSYRHWFWDCGVIAANLLAITSDMGLPTKIVMGFVDDQMDKLLNLEERKEATIAMAPIGINSPTAGDSKKLIQNLGEVDEIRLLSPTRIRPLSKKGEIYYPEIWELNNASKLASRDEVTRWITDARHNDADNYYRNPDLPTRIRNPEEKDVIDASKNLMQNEFEDVINTSLNLKETILWRGSSRKFLRRPISLSTLKTILYTATGGVQMDMIRDGETLIDIYFVANEVEGLESGAYFYDQKSTVQKKLKQTSTSRTIAEFLCLGQPLFGDASAVFFLMTDLQATLKLLGNRGYRACQQEAGIIAGKLYLASYALRLGASGSTFFDDAVTEFFSPYASKKSTMIVVGVGIPAYKARQGKILTRCLNKKQLMNQEFS